MIYTYLDVDKLCVATRALRFAYNSMMAQVTAFRLSCFVEATPCMLLSTGKYENLDNSSHQRELFIIIIVYKDYYLPISLLPKIKKYGLLRLKSSPISTTLVSRLNLYTSIEYNIINIIMTGI